jgi:predicted Zn-dependent protease
MSEHGEGAPAEPSEALPRAQEESVLTSAELVEVGPGILAPDVVTAERAARVLAESFGPLLDADYLPGKTALSDALAEQLGLSILTAEELCDELEQTGRIRFIRTEEATAWHIHTEADAR